MATNHKLILKNPFAVKSPEELSPQEIVDLFVKSYTKIEAVKERRHTFIWGSRGSGKSMMLRYLEPQCKTIVHENLSTFFSNEHSFFAVYCPCKEGQLNKTELDLLAENPRLIITEHILNLFIAERTINCLMTQTGNMFDGKAESSFVDNILKLFDKAAIASSCAYADSSVDRSKFPLKWLQELLFDELNKISRYLRLMVFGKDFAAYEAAVTGYHDFLLPFIKYVKELLTLPDIPIYILVDDADRLTIFGQTIVNTWIANRDQRDICIKISARREGYLTFRTRDKVEIEDPHDYSVIDVDELYTQNKSDYSQKVTLICDRRLELSPVPTKNITEFLPPDIEEQKQLERIRKETADEWEKLGKPGTKQDFINRYSIARLFQELKKTKQRKSYAGFDNIVHLSSGIVRDFLEPCYLMFDRLIDKGEQANKIKCIPPGLQNHVLFEYSEEFVIHKFDDIKKGLPKEKWADVQALSTLIASLGKLFYQKLHDPSARDARLFSFTINGTVSQHLEEILKLGIEFRYLQLRSYSSKTGGGRERWYILNRRVCPAFKLDPTGFEGRITISAELLNIACQDTEKFVKSRLKQVNEADSLLFALEESE